ncbi:alpha/beta hydrolase [Hymenobacter cellulosivorans]|uniref:Alpha/beta hydrolase-fold protein n=1 Tax=Hymenobacter cellulosivorans TaxID=2932249 RepID=A0ABY4F7W1_9BACT|nr:alpha/beta hydrolase-fold protein [Hymenobacter cellulosivorans]UOQ52004.1 alpha/beta hydrolase-fold protein [Hymenobacter cellulosivorans]
MNTKHLFCGFLLLLLATVASQATAQTKAAPLVIGETFTIASKILGETRRINVYLPAGYAETPTLRLPVLYMPDGGLAEDFLHVAGLVQVGVGNNTMRPFILVGIENTQRRRDLTGPTTVAEDKKIAPKVGESVAFRKFIRQELMPQVQHRYRTTPEKAIVGESLAGLFVVETLLLEPDLFDHYLAFDPSLWWNNEQLVSQAAATIKAYKGPAKTLFMTSSDEPVIAAASARLAKILQDTPNPALTWHYESMPTETHGTIYHPSALRGFRYVFKPAPESATK